MNPIPRTKPAAAIDNIAYPTVTGRGRHSRLGEAYRAASTLWVVAWSGRSWRKGLELPHPS